MTATPEIYDRRPVRLDMDPGVYYWCACGRSGKQPFCDGSHAGTGLEPQRLDITEKQTIAFCNCKHSSLGYQCDGAHKSL